MNVRIETQDGREIVVARNDPQLHHLDHAYSSTVHAAQGLTCDRVIAVLDTDGGRPADQAMFYVELTRARDNVVLLTDDREALIEALETAPAEELSALKSDRRAVRGRGRNDRTTLTPGEGSVVLDDATRERRREAQRFVDHTLSAAAASLRERDERAREAHSHGAHVTLASRLCRMAARAPGVCSPIAARSSTTPRPSRGISTAVPAQADEMKRLSAQIGSDLKADQCRDRAAVKSGRNSGNWSGRCRSSRSGSARKAKTRDRGGLSM